MYEEPPISIPKVSHGGAILGFFAGFVGSAVGFVLVRVFSKREEVRRGALWGFCFSLGCGLVGGQVLRWYQAEREHSRQDVLQLVDELKERSPAPPPGGTTMPGPPLPRLDAATQALAEANGLLARGDRAGAEQRLQSATHEFEGRADPAQVADLLKAHARLRMVDAPRAVEAIGEAIGDIEHAAALESTVQFLSPVDRAGTANLLGTALALAGRLTDARTAFTRASSYRADDPAEDALATIGLAIVDLHGKSHGADMLLAKGIDLATRVEGPLPAFGFVLERQATLLHSLGKTDAANTLASLVRTRHPMPHFDVQ